MNFKILERDPSVIIDDEFKCEFSDFSGHPAEGSDFYLNAAIEMIEQCLDISLTSMKIEICLPESKNTVCLPFRTACSVIEAKHIDCNGNSIVVNPMNIRLVSGKLFLPVNDYSWIITYITEPFNIDTTTKLGIFKIALMIVEGEDHLDDRKIRKMLKQYDVRVGSTIIPH